MSFTSVLKGIEEGALKAGSVFAQIEGVVPIFEPLINALVPQTKVAMVGNVEKEFRKVDLTFKDLTDITKQIQLIGVKANLTDDQKLQQEVALVGQLLQTYGHITDKNLGDPVEVQGGIEDLMKAVIRIQKGLKAKS